MVGNSTPFAKLLLTLALAVNLLVPFAHSSPLFKQVCVGADVILVPSEEGNERDGCDFCLVTCAAGLIAPEAARGGPRDIGSIAYDTLLPFRSPLAIMPRQQARSPPPFSV
jgi:hypothetical protein